MNQQDFHPEIRPSNHISERRKAMAKTIWLRDYAGKLRPVIDWTATGKPILGKA